MELTVWDWTGDLRYLQVQDHLHHPVDYQLLDASRQKYWDHMYFRVLVDVEVPSMGYTTIVLCEGSAENYRNYFQSGERVARRFENLVLQNDKIKATVAADSGRICSLVNTATNEEFIADGESAGLVFVETEAATSSAWEIGRYLKEISVDECVKMEKVAEGPLRQSFKMYYVIKDSKIEVTYRLDRHAEALRTDFHIDWHEIGGETVPLLQYRVPTVYKTNEFLYDIPGGAIRRPAGMTDVPALQYGVAVSASGDSIIVVSDSKYGYRGLDQSLGLSLINSSTGPDPYPEFGIQKVTLWTGAIKADEKAAAGLAERCNHAMFYQPSNAHKGNLPLQDSLFSFHSDTVVLSSSLPTEDGGIIVRLYEVKGITGKVVLRFHKPVRTAKSVDLFEKEGNTPVFVQDCHVSCEVAPNSICELKILL